MIKDIFNLVSSLSPLSDVNLSEMEEIVLSYPKLKERLKDKVEDREKALKNLKQEYRFMVKIVAEKLLISFSNGFENFILND